MRYGSALDYNRDRLLPSSEVRVSYFGQKTGEPLDYKPEPIGEAARRIAAREKRKKK